MATLYKQAKSPNWYAQYFNAEGRRVSKTTGTTKKREAEKIAATFEAKEHERRQSGDAFLPRKLAAILEIGVREADAGKLTLARFEELLTEAHRTANPTFREVSLAEHLGEWIERQRPHVSAKSALVYEDMRRRMLAALGPKIAKAPVGALRQSDIEKALGKIVKMPIAATRRPRSAPRRKNAKRQPARTITAATANMDLAALRRALRDAVAQDLAKVNPAEGIRALPTSDSTERAPFTAEEVRAMIDHASTPDEWRGCILIAAHTGLRLGDVIRLRREHLQGSRLVIRPEKTKRTRKTLSVPLTPPCLRWIGDRQGDLFPSLTGRKTGTLSTQFRRIMERAGVAREIVEAGDVVKRRSFHSLRHSFASWLAEADVHADVRQRLTGHSSAGVHARYTHHDEALDRAVESLPNFEALGS